VKRWYLATTLLVLGACSDDTGGKDGGMSGLDIPDFAGITDCLNALATDDNCPQKCFKERGSGLSYCAHTCTMDPDCAGKSHAWIPSGAGLVCHPNQGYCTRRCMDDFDCQIGGHTDLLRCDPMTKVCTSCVNGC
jgi:hypothetical protein